MKRISVKTDFLKTGLLVETVQQLSMADSIEDIMKVVRNVARDITGADGATFVLRDGDLCYYADENAISPLWKGSRFPMDTCISGWVMLNKLPASIYDIYQDDRIPADAYRPTFVKSLAMVPIRQSEPIGAIGNYWAKQHEPTSEELALLQSLADITAVSIQNVEYKEKLEEKIIEGNRMVQELKDRKKQMEEFTNIVAHNLRAPLSNLVLLNDMIEKTSDPEKKLLFLSKQKPSVTFLHETFEELVKAIQVKSQFGKKCDHIDIEEYILKTLGSLQLEIDECNAEVSWDITQEKTAYFPKEYFTSILFNLLSNALRYRSPDRIPEIKIRTYKLDGWSYLEVQDNGLGIDLQKYGDKIFGLHKTFHAHPQAKGFGLFITKNQIESMGGKISVKSKPNLGTLFTIKLFKNK